MAAILFKELEQVRKRVLAVGAQVEDAIAKSITAVTRRDGELARSVMALDPEIDRMEIEVEEECLKILALHQPVAYDLRFIVTVLKMNNDLERMGDHAVNIAKRALYMARHEPVEWPVEITEMSYNVKTMVKECLDALIRADSAMARRVCDADDTVDAQKRRIIAALRQEILAPDDAGVEVRIKMLDVPRHLERIADLATNIAEDVIYLVEGAIARHHHLDDETP